MNRSLLLPALAAAIFGLAACTMYPAYYNPKVPPESSAVLTGLKIANSDPAAPDTRVYVTKVDAVLLPDRMNLWAYQTVLLPGTHSITFGVSQKSAFHDAWGFGQLQVNFEAGKSYHLHANQPARVTAHCSVAEGWIEADGAGPITEKVSVRVVEWTGSEIPLNFTGFVGVASTTICPPG